MSLPRFVKNENQLVLETVNGMLSLDFISELRKLSLGKNELIAKAVGVSKGLIDVIDVTAGLGQDAIVLARLGCKVRAIEKSDWIYPLLADAYNRALALSKCEETLEKKFTWLEKIRFIHADSIHYLLHLQKEEYPEVIYIDPMFPASKKSALPKKEMQIFRSLLIEEDVAESTRNLCELALSKVKKRVVIKRPLHGPELLPGCTHKFCGSSIRYDMYTT